MPRDLSVNIFTEETQESRWYEIGIRSSTVWKTYLQIRQNFFPETSRNY